MTADHCTSELSSCRAVDLARLRASVYAEQLSRRRPARGGYRLYTLPDADATGESASLST